MTLASRSSVVLRTPRTTRLTTTQMVGVLARGAPQVSLLRVLLRITCYPGQAVRPCIIECLGSEAAKGPSRAHRPAHPHRSHLHHLLLHPRRHLLSVIADQRADSAPQAFASP